MKSKFKQFGNRAEKALDVETEWETYKKQYATSTSGSETINFDLRICHYKGKLAFDKKDSLIEKVEDLVGVEFKEIVDEAKDLKTFKDSWKDDRNAEVKKKADKLIKNIEKLLKKEAKKELNEYLQQLYLQDNQLNVLPASISQCKALTKLSIHDNKLQELPKDIGNLKALKDLNLKGNELPKTTLETLKTALPNCKIEHD